MSKFGERRYDIMKILKRILIGIVIGIAIIILAGRLFSMIDLFDLLFGGQKYPEIAKAEFPFVVEYVMDGETYIIEDIVVCEFDGFDGMFPNQRCWSSYLKSGNEAKCELIREENTKSVLKPSRINELSRLVLDYGSAEYYMDDPQGRSMIDKDATFEYRENWKVSEKVTDVEHTKLNAKQLKKYFNIEIVRFEFSKPIKNEFK